MPLSDLQHRQRRDNGEWGGVHHGTLIVPDAHSVCSISMAKAGAVFARGMPDAARESIPGDRSCVNPPCGDFVNPPCGDLSHPSLHSTLSYALTHGQDFGSDKLKKRMHLLKEQQKKGKRGDARRVKKNIINMSSMS